MKVSCPYFEDGQKQCKQVHHNNTIFSSHEDGWNMLLSCNLPVVIKFWQCCFQDSHVSRGRNCDKHCVRVAVRVHVSGGMGGLRKTRITQRGRNGLSQFHALRPAQCFMHYTVLMILRLKSTQNGRLQQRVRRNFIGVSSVLILGYLAAGIQKDIGIDIQICLPIPHN